MINPRVIGHIVAVQGFRVKVELLTEARSPSRATLDGVQTSVAINAYLLFSIGAGDLVIGIITDLEARESFDPTAGEELTLELVKPRRVANVQLLGTINRDGNEAVFSPGITVLPTLDTPGEIGSPDILKAVFETPPVRNRPQGYDKDDFDYDLSLGSPTGQRESRVKASYNDLLSRPLAIVGNTGSGKSFTVSSIVQKAMAALGDTPAEPHVYLLDINGEYSRAFLSEEQSKTERAPDRIYLDGAEFSIPIWLFNSLEICAWLSAAEQTQEPVLKDWWAIAKGQNVDQVHASANRLQHAMSAIDALLEDLSSIKRKSAPSYCEATLGFLKNAKIDTAAFAKAFEPHRGIDKFNTEVLSNQAEIAAAAEALKQQIRELISQMGRLSDDIVRTADSPLYIPKQTLVDPSMINRAVSKEDTFRVESHLTTLKLRLKTRLDDRRWRAFLNYEDNSRHKDPWPMASPVWPWGTLRTSGVGYRFIHAQPRGVAVRHECNRPGFA
jgi:Helicase HerA, central domain